MYPLGLKYIPPQTQKQPHSPTYNPQRPRQTFISTSRDPRQSRSKDQRPYVTSPNRLDRNDSTKKNTFLPPKAVTYQRSTSKSIEKKEKQHNEATSIEKNNGENRKEVLRFSQLKKRLDEELKERERLQEVTACQEIKMANLQEEINKLRTQKKEFEKTILGLQKSNEENIKNLGRAQDNIDQLNKSLRQAKINQKTLGTLKNLQNQLDYLQERNKKLTLQNQELIKANKHLKNDLQKLTRDCTSQSDCSIKVPVNPSIKQTMSLPSTTTAKTQQDVFLEANFHQLEKKLYEKENQIKKLQIQLNCIDRKKVMSINEVRNRKDFQLKVLRQKFMKVTKDLKDTKDKYQKTDKKSKQSAFLRKVKSSKQLGMASQSELTFELSSQV